MNARWSDEQALTALAAASALLVGVTSSVTELYVPLVISSALIALCGVVIVGRYGAVSAESIVGALFLYPLIVPGLARYVFRLDRLILRGYQFQTPTTVRAAVWYAALAAIIFVLTLRFLEDPVLDNEIFRTAREYRLRRSDAFMVITSAFVLVGAYLTTPGPTILQVSYDQVRDNYASWAAFAGSLFMAASVVTIVYARPYPERDWRFILTVTVVLTGVVWLLLHARRNESLGTIALLLFEVIRRLDIQRGEIRERIGIAAVAVGVTGSAVVVELMRSGRDVSGLFTQQLAEATYPAAPGGAHNIWGTWLATVSVTTGNHSLGYWLVVYPGNSLPSVTRQFIPLPSGLFYSDALEATYSTYIGGSYILNQPFADFGAFGALVMASVLAVIARAITELYIRGDDYASLTAVAGGALLAPITRAMWYTPTAWFDVIWGVGVVLTVYVVVLLGRVRVGIADESDDAVISPWRANRSMGLSDSSVTISAAHRIAETLRAGLRHSMLRGLFVNLGRVWHRSRLRDVARFLFNSSDDGSRS